MTRIEETSMCRGGERRPRKVVPTCCIVLFLTLGLLASACSQETRDRIQEGLPSGASGRPTALPSRTGTIELPTAGPTGPTRSETEEPTTEPTEEPSPQPTQEPTTETTAQPTPEPTEGPADGEHGDVIVAIIAIIRRLLEAVPQPPTESPSPTKPPKPSESPEPTEQPEESPTGATEPVTGPTGPSLSAVPTGPSGSTGIAQGGATGPTGDDQAAEIVSAAASNSSEDPWIWAVAIVVLVGIGWVVWSLTHRRRSGSPPSSDERPSSSDSTSEPG